MILEDLICTNIMQRGVGNINPMKMAKCIMELERIKGIRQGSAGGNGSNQYNKMLNPNNSDEAKYSQKQLATDLNIKQDTITNYKKLLNLIPELQQMIENGSMKATVGSLVNMKGYVILDKGDKKTELISVFLKTR